MLVLQCSVRTTHHGLFISQYVSTVVLGTENSSWLVYFLSLLVPQYLVWTIHRSLFISQYIGTLVVSMDNVSWLVYFLVHWYRSTQYGQRIMACLFLSTLVLSYSVQSTHHGLFISQYVSMLVLQYPVWSTHHGLLISQYVSTLVPGTDNSSRLVYFLLRQYCSTQYGELITACLFLSTLVLQQLVRSTHYSLFIAQYVSTVVLGTDNSPWLVYFLVRQYHSTRYGQLITACLFPQFVSTVVLGMDNSSRLVYFLVSQYLNTRYRQLITACLLLSTLVLQYSVRTTHHGLFISQYVSNRVLSMDNSSRLVLHLFSALVC